ncbi:ArgS-related anticodon-binding protein NrtL [Streptomyces sp. NPDC020141]|uniref:ArgS-related anticodon-binding protein NrtL n=1 Tax=Streptomyces sp. NPDC020141 TaxID=3365065 RepID=UPI0037B09E00
MTPAELSRTVLHAVCRAVEDGVLPAPAPESVLVERPGPGGCGDYATNVALRLAGAAGRPPRAVAETLKERIGRNPAIAAVEITGPGFLNITLAEGAQRALIRTVLEQGPGYGQPAAAHRTHESHRAAEVRPEAGPDAEAGPEAVAGPEVGPAAAARRAAEAGPGPGADSAEEPRARLWNLTVDRLRRTQTAAARTAAHAGTRAAAPAAPHADARPAPAPAPPYDPALGADAVRWAMLSVAAHDRPRIGPELLRQHESNPLFTVRYAHSRTRALTRGARLLGFAAEPGEYVDTPLTGLIADYPGVLASAARLRAPDRLARHLESTADAVLGLQHTVLPIGDEKPTAAHRSRLAIAEAAGTVLAGGLSLLGVSAPEHL